jgi:hypothetical protein
LSTLPRLAETAVGRSLLVRRGRQPAPRKEIVMVTIAVARLI